MPELVALVFAMAIQKAGSQLVLAMCVIAMTNHKARPRLVLAL